MSESYTVVLSPQAIEDLRSIYSYIAYELQVPNIAQEQISRIRNGIRALDFLPFRYPMLTGSLGTASKHISFPLIISLFFIKYIQTPVWLPFFVSFIAGVIYDIS